MKHVEATGKTLNEAIEKGLKELNISKDLAEVEVIDEGNKGFLGLLGTKEAKVLVKLNIDWAKQSAEIVRNILSMMNINTTVKSKIIEEDIIEIDIDGENLGLVIGKRGETLDAIQYLVNLMVNKKAKEVDGKIRIVIDAQGYRAKRQESLERLAKRIASKVEKKGKRISLEPMNAYERRIIHIALKGEYSINTFSEGEEPYRKVVIAPKKSN